jgi:biopolymer transport protein ExbD
MLAFREFEARFDKKKSADFTPLIDVVFNLLLYYLLTSSVMVSSFLVSLPAAESAVEKTPAGHTLSVTRTGALYWDSKPIGRDELKRALREAQPKKLSLEADAEATFGKVTELMDLARLSGFEEVSFTVLGNSP